MSKEVEQRVVEMRFDNGQFERNVSTTMSTLDKLKQKLGFSGATKGFEDINSAAKKVDMNGLSKGIETVQSKFSSLQVIGVTALANITNSAVNAGKQLVSAFTIDPIKTGFQEYETQINAVQTILANTESKGSTLTQVNKALDELNTYADQTIYNFTEMTRNIGTFTAAGVDLDKSVTSIKGIANLAAVSGSTSQQASTAMYQLSQALAAGKVQLMDWNSVVNAGMGGELFQNALKRTATQMGTNVDALIEKYGSFRESLTKGEWLTAEVLTETLTQLSGAYTEADLIAQGYSESQAKEIVQLAETAVNAATKVKTFTQLFDTLKEAAQSGWTETWEILVGDFEEAKAFLTELSETFGDLIGQSADARNKLLYDSMASNWKKLTDEINNAGLSAEDFKTKVEEIAKSKGVDVAALVEEYGSLELAFKNGAISSEYLDQALAKMTGTSSEVVKKFEEATKGFENQDQILLQLRRSGYELSDEMLHMLGLTDREIATIQELSTQYRLASGSAKAFTDNIAVPSGRELLIDAIRVSIRNLIAVFETVGDAWREVFPPATADQVYGIAKSIQEFALALRPSEDTLNKLTRTFKGFFSILDIGRKLLSSVFSPIFEFLGGGAASSFGSSLLDITAKLGDFFTRLNEGIDESSTFSIISDIVSAALNGISTAVSAVYNSVGGFGGLLTGIGTTVANVFKGIKDTVAGVFNWIRENVTSADIFAVLMGGGVGLAGGGIFALVKKFGGAIDSIKDSLENLFNFGKGNSKFSEILTSVHDSLNAFSQGIRVASLIGIAAAVGVLTLALKKISEIEPTKIAYSLVAIRLMIASLNSGFKSLTKTLTSFNAKGTLKASIAMIAMATAVNILASAMQKVAELSWTEILKGLTTISVALLALSASIKIIGKSGVTLRTSIAILALAAACSMLSGALQEFGSMSWDEIARGLVAMGGALAELTAVLAIISKVGGGGALLGSIGLLIAVQSLDEIAEALKQLGQLSWEEIGKGLVAMGGALGEFTVVLSVISKVGGGGALLGGAALLIAAQSLDEISDTLERLGKLSWSEITRGLSAMGGALAELGVTIGLLGKFTGFSGLLGAGAILLGVQGLGKLADALQQFGSMSWEEIGKGLTTMGGALLELGVVFGALGKLTGLSGLLGAGTILLGVQSLGDLAAALQQFGGMTWDEIKMGLVAMGGALLEVSVIVGVLGKLTGLSGLLGAGAILLGIQGLGDLADALVKFGSMSWEEIGVGLVAMGGALAELAIISGVLGSVAPIAALVGSGSLALATQGLEDLADALIKFGSMSWDEIGRGLTAMGGALGETAIGGLLNTLSIIGAISISVISASLGDLADSVKKWEGVEVPEGLGEQLGSLASGILSFTFGGFGANAIATLATPLGDLADSIKKWEGIVIPAELGTGLSGLAEGVKAFNFAFLGSWSISSLVQPLGDLADTVRKWNNVRVPTEIKTSLQNLADGVSAFNFSWFSGWSIDGIVEPLADLADSMKKWNDVTFYGLGDRLMSMAEGLEALGEVGVKGLVSEFENASDKMSKAVTDILNTITSTIGNKKQEIITAGENIIMQLTNGINNKASSLTKAFESVMSKSVNAIRKEYRLFYNAGSYIVEGLAAGIKASSYKAVNEAKALAKAVSDATRSVLGIHSPSEEFYEIGEYSVEGLTLGVEDSLSDVEDASADIGESLYSQIDTNAAATKAEVQEAAESVASLEEEVVAQSEKVQEANDEYQKTMAEFGETADETLTAYNKVLEEQERMAELSAQLAEAQEREIEANKAALNSYIDWMKTYGSMLTKSGFSAEQINSAAQSATGYSGDLVFMGSGGAWKDYEYWTKAFDENEYLEIINDATNDLDNRIANASVLINLWGKTYEAAVKEFGETSDEAIAAKEKLDATYSNRDNLDFLKANTDSFSQPGVYDLSKSGEAIGKSLSEGISKGLTSSTSMVKSSAASVANATANAVKSTLGIKSPSKVFYQLGSYTITGFINALKNGATQVYSSASELADKVTSGISNSISMVQTILENGIDLEPTIRPVLDLSSVETGASRINTLFSRKQAMSISSGMNKDNTTEIQNGENGTQSGTTIAFTQNNYSPKALSRVEIYRQTRNQLSAVERMVKK